MPKILPLLIMYFNLDLLHIDYVEYPKIKRSGHKRQIYLRNNFQVLATDKQKILKSNNNENEGRANAHA